MSKSPVLLALVGRPNVGKSTLFNRFVGHRAAIVRDIPGVTRDRNYGMGHSSGYEFLVVDTGGFEPYADSSIMKQMRHQAEVAVEDADIIIFIVDGVGGLAPGDIEIYRQLSRSSKPLFLAINKADNDRIALESSEFYQLGAETLFPISAAHNRGIVTLMDAVHAVMPLSPYEKPKRGKESKSEEEPDISTETEPVTTAEAVRVAIIGKPNAGKSSLTNALLRKERMIVDPMAGTTRDPVDSLCRYHDQEFLIIDTAGIRRKAKVRQKIETFSIVSALKSIERAEVVLLVIDAEEGVTEQVLRIAGYAYERNRAIVIVMNKWDLVKKDSKTQKRFKEDIYERLNFITFAPILFLSAMTGQRVPQVFEKILSVHQQYKRRIQTSDLNSILEEILWKHAPPSKSGKPTKIYYGNQVTVGPPTFVLMVNHPEKINVSYRRYLDNQFRYHFGFEGTPLQMICRKKNESRKG